MRTRLRLYKMYLDPVLCRLRLVMAVETLSEPTDVVGEWDGKTVKTIVMELKGIGELHDAGRVGVDEIPVAINAVDVEEIEALL